MQILPSSSATQEYVRVSIFSVLDSQHALLLIIIGGQGLYKGGNVLLDSGAQLSLNRLETAESLQ